MAGRSGNLYSCRHHCDFYAGRNTGKCGQHHESCGRGHPNLFKAVAQIPQAFAANGKHTALRKVAPAKPVEKLIAVLALIICVAGSIAGRIYL